MAYYGGWEGCGMNVSYDIARMKSIVDDICELTQVSISIVDTQFNHIYCCEKGDDSYCHQIQATALGQHKCHHSDGEMLRRCMVEKRPITSVCHAGVLDTVLPIIKEEAVVGFLFLGRVRLQADKQPPPLLEWTQEPQAVAAQYEKLTCLSQTRLDALIRLLSQSLFANAITVEHGNAVHQATEYIREHLAEELTVERLCAALHVSKNALYRCFRETYGCTVNEYVTARRMELAKELLVHSEDSIVQVAQAAGFYNYTYFSRLFRARTGLAPREYRAQIRPKSRRKT